MQKYILALDQGTTSSRSVLFDNDGNVVGMEQKEFHQIFPQLGWVEHDPMEIWETQFSTAIDVLTKNNISAEQIDSIGITNQRETTIIWDKNTGEPIYNALVWQDKRTAPICEQLKSAGHAEFVQFKTGLIIDSYFSSTKIQWILENVEGAMAKAERGDLLFGTVDSWLVWKLTGGRIHATDYTNASRTMLYDIRNLKWDDELLELFHIPRCMLPEVKNSSDDFGMTDIRLFGKSIPITGVAGDQQASLFGQRCWKEGEAKNTYGTGCFMLLNTGEKLIQSKFGLISTIAIGLGGRVHYALEGSVFIAGAAIQWLRDGLQIIPSSNEAESMAMHVEDNGGVFMVPAFVGLGAPHWDMYARGAIFGLTRGSNKFHLVRATLEALAYQSRDVLDAMNQESGIHLQVLKVDGGACRNNFLMQFQSDILNKTVERPTVIETTALGAAYLAGIKTGFYQMDHLVKSKIDRRFEPSMEEDKRAKLYVGWQKALKRTMNWEE